MEGASPAQNAPDAAKRSMREAFGFSRWEWFVGQIEFRVRYLVYRVTGRV